MKKSTKILISILLILSILLCCNILYCENVITSSYYSITTDKLHDSAKIVFISDLHNREYGKNNSKLVEKIKIEEPDIIAVTGDMISKTDETYDVTITLLNSLVEIAPTYYVLGNHEKQYEDLESLINDIKETKTTFLDNQTVTINLGNDKINIGGLTDYPYYSFDGPADQIPHFDNDESVFLDNFIAQSKNRFSVLLAHQPEYYMWKLKYMDIDLMLCGHTHGGLLSIPFIGGLYAPNQGFFPEYSKGYYSSDTAQMIITGGLGNSIFVPRINNQVEISIVQIN